LDEIQPAGSDTAMTTMQTWENFSSLLSRHPIALELNRLGVMEEQLETIRFWRTIGKILIDFAGLD